MIKLFKNICQKQINKARIVIVMSIIFLYSCEPKTSLPDPLEAGWKNKAVCELLEDNAKVRVLRCTFLPGVGHEKHYHKSHFGYALKGSTFKITDETGIREVEVPSGSSFYNDGIKWHEVLNIGDSTAIFLIVEPK